MTVVHRVSCFANCDCVSAEKMISSEMLDGVPLLVLANKQDVPVLCDR